MLTITEEQRAAIAAKLDGMHIPSGLGTEDEACSVAAINLALTGELTAEIPACMSLVIGNWILDVQDAMSDAMRNGADWRYLLPLAAGTGRDHEQQRIDIILDWMWDALALVQPTADEEGFGNEWRTMCTERTPDAVANAAEAAKRAAYAASRAANRAAYAAASRAANRAEYAAANRAAAKAADMAYAAGNAAIAAKAAKAADMANAAEAAKRAAYAANRAAKRAANRAYAENFDFWQQINPPALLLKLINVTHEVK